MEPLYRRTFDQVRMSGEAAERVRASLASRCAQKKLEVNNMKNTTKIRRPLAAAAALCAALVLTVTAFASSGLAEHVFHMLSGDTISVGMDESGNVRVDQALSEEPVSPVEVREDGRVFFTAGGEELDITGQFSYETPYVRECTDADGQCHVFIIGGEPDAVGWAECMLEDGDTIAMSAFVLNLAPEAEDQPAPWLGAGMEQLLDGDGELYVEIS